MRARLHMCKKSRTFAAESYIGTKKYAVFDKRRFFSETLSDPSPL